MFNRIFGHLKTTLSGVMLAVLQVLVSGVDWKHLALAAGTAALGALAKDK